MGKYELLYTLAAKYTEPEIASVKEGITSELTKLGISISRNEEVGKIKLAYPMQHVRYGHYVLVEFSAEPTALTKVNEFLRLHNEVLRHQVVRPDANAKPFTQLADPEIRLERRTETVPVGSTATVPVNEPVATGPALTQEEIDKKLNALEEDITKSL